MRTEKAGAFSTVLLLNKPHPVEVSEIHGLISSDSLRAVGDRRKETVAASAYDAPERITGGDTPAAPLPEGNTPQDPGKRERGGIAQGDDDH